MMVTGWLEDALIAVPWDEEELHSMDLTEDEQRRLRNWRSFHLSTKFKLEAADYFCRLILGLASMPDMRATDFVNTLISWHLDAFFYELMSAYGVLLQELNTACRVGLKVPDVKWKALRSKLPCSVRKLMEDEWKANWFKKLRSCRNTATHHQLIPVGTVCIRRIGDPNWEAHKTSMYYPDWSTGSYKGIDISVCRDYFEKMLAHIRGIWRKMAEEFQQL